MPYSEHHNGNPITRGLIIQPEVLTADVGSKAHFVCNGGSSFFHTDMKDELFGRGRVASNFAKSSSSGENRYMIISIKGMTYIA